MGLFTKDNGRDSIGMVMVFKYGLMVRGMKENGSTTKLMEKESSGT